MFVSACAWAYGRAHVLCISTRISARGVDHTAGDSHTPAWARRHWRRWCSVGWCLLNPHRHACSIQQGAMAPFHCASFCRSWDLLGRREGGRLPMQLSKHGRSLLVCRWVCRTACGLNAECRSRVGNPQTKHLNISLVLGILTLLSEYRTSMKCRLSTSCSESFAKRQSIIKLIWNVECRQDVGGPTSMKEDTFLQRLLRRPFSQVQAFKIEG